MRAAEIIEELTARSNREEYTDIGSGGGNPFAFIAIAAAGIGLFLFGRKRKEGAADAYN